ncbi:hypothetical protein E7T09_05660 [Deinococcus sp. KSM4-11]|uniref:hypothetical protein n=1 Tax=Deinococcus sp. KSM4-11 TaxID=2568654 RepID=UPI0010A4B50A|nr:hypothetical protein [Deinococcus sp. KSM4-11]THF88669.1 hypothetical protein E7T09_05660 [Deinococcus sp. KSM4-11]
MTTHASAATDAQPALKVVPHDLKGLSKDVRALNARLRDVAASDHLEELMKLIPRPGWTTPAEFELVRGIVAQMALQVSALEQAQGMLLRGANLVGART